jgi:hypothetical protein
MLTIIIGFVKSLQQHGWCLLSLKLNCIWCSFKDLFPLHQSLFLINWISGCQP